MTHKEWIGLLALIVLLSRLPFLNAGYGNDPDAWQMANAARSIATTGEYTASRLPGYPLPEIIYSLIGLHNPIFFNVITAALSAIAFSLFILILWQVHARHYLLAGLTLAFCPVIFINSTNAMDYVWALTFILASTYLVLTKRTLGAAMCLGLAIGCRITSGAMLLPLSLMLVHAEGKIVVRSLLKFVVIACLFGAICFVPVFLYYGPAFLAFIDRYPPLLWVVYSGSIGVWGTIGSCALLFMIVSQIWTMRRDGIAVAQLNRSANKLLMLAWLLTIGLYTVAFLRLPHDGAYLMPMIPFVILVLDRFLSSKRFVIACVAIILSSFFIHVERTAVSFVGPIFADHQERIEKITYTERYATAVEQLEHKSLIIAGQWLPALKATLPQPFNPNVEPNIEIVNLPNEINIHAYLDRGFQVYYLAGQRQLTLELYQFDLANLGALPLIQDENANVKW